MTPPSRSSDTGAFPHASEDSADVAVTSDQGEDVRSKDASASPSSARSEDALTSRAAPSEDASTSQVSEADSQGSADDTDAALTHGDMLMASLLEDHFLNRAAEALNQASPPKRSNPREKYGKQSRQVKPLAHRLFTQAAHTLASTGVLPAAAASDSLRDVRQRYLQGLDSLGAGATVASQVNPRRRRQSAIQASSDVLLPSHYRTFREVRLLGRGGFGKVYQCYNLVDHQTYAVKKIPLSPSLSRIIMAVRQGQLPSKQIKELDEVRALAQLDHANIVRYHHTWIEEPELGPEPEPYPDSPSVPLPVTPPRQSQLLPPRQSQRLLQGPNVVSEEDSSLQSDSISDNVVFGEDSSLQADGISDNIVFGHESPSQPDGISGNVVLGHKSPSQPDGISDGISESPDEVSNIFTDGNGATSSRQVVGRGHHTTMPLGVFVIHIQMSMYPMTLARYLSAAPPARSEQVDFMAMRHCYHLKPTLDIIRSVLDGLQYIHAHNFVHRDIKPGNIFLSSPASSPQAGYCDASCRSCSPTGEVTPRWLNPRIGDFGLVGPLANVAASSPYSSDAPGTAYYRAPNQPVNYRRGDGERTDIGEKTDIFALGVVFVEMLCRLQEGCLPAGLDQGLRACDEYDECTARRAVELATAMVEPDLRKRWTGSEVKKGIDEILERWPMLPRGAA